MIKNYIKIAIRTLASQKVLTGINIVGLSIGLACFSLFLLYSINELSYDSFHKNANSIYRVYEWSDGIPGANPSGDAGMYMPLGPAVQHDFPDVENYVRFQSYGTKVFIKSDKTALPLRIAYTDPQLFTVFSFKLIFGDPSTALSDPGKVVITKNTAIDLFGTTNVVGKTLEIKASDKFEPFTISAVADNVPANSSINFDFLLSFDYFQSTPFGKMAVNNWSFSGFQTFVQLRRGSSLPNDPKRFSKFREKYFPAERAQLKTAGLWDGKSAYPINFRLEPIEKIHTTLTINDGNPQSHIDVKNIWLLLGIATAVLLIACINFTTLSIGRSAGRAKEVGVRKVLGSARSQLIFQFLTDSLMLSIFSAIIGLMIAKLLLPYFNELADRKLSFSFSQYPQLIWSFAGIILLTGILSGSYPALVLSRFKPVEVLRKKVRLSGRNFFTNSLVTVQFVVSIALIISTIIILQQLNYMRSKNPGFNKDNVVVVDADGTNSKEIYPRFKQVLAENPQIAGITSSDVALGEEGYNMSGFKYNGKDIQAFHYATAPDYIQVTGMQLVAGRNFNPLIVSDTINSVIINEALVRNLGLTNDKAPGLRLEGYSGDKRRTPVVIGVVKDFNFFSLRQEVKPIIFNQPPDLAPSKFFVRIKPVDPTRTLAFMNNQWKKIVPDIPFKYNFLDDNLDSFYKGETRLVNIMGWAGGISIFLACLGLFGLTALSAANRAKEIGIRKVLGASVSTIIQLLSKDVVRLVLFSLVVASPLAWYFMKRWLQDYAYRIHIQWWVFVITGISTFLIAFITAGFQAIRVATANPIKSLRIE